MKMTKPWAVAALCCLFTSACARADVFNFEGLPLGNPGADGSTPYGATGKYYWNGSNGAGGFTTANALGTLRAKNVYDPTYGSWDGFSYSNTTDVASLSYTNQYSAIPGAGAGGSANYAVGYQPYFGEWSMTFSTPVSLADGGGFSLTNTTIAYYSLLNGDGFAKKFGGASGNDPDFFKLTIYGWNGAAALGAVDFYLADYRFADHAQDYIVNAWTTVDLSAFGGAVDKLTFGLSSSDVGDFGMNTPAYFALDNVTVSAVPEPSAAALLLAGLGAAAWAASRRRSAAGVS